MTMASSLLPGNPKRIDYCICICAFMSMKVKFKIYFENYKPKHQTHTLQKVQEAVHKDELGSDRLTVHYRTTCILPI